MSPTTATLILALILSAPKQQEKPVPELFNPELPELSPEIAHAQRQALSDHTLRQKTALQRAPKDKKYNNRKPRRGAAVRKGRR